MQVTVLGGTRRIGRLVVDQALAKGHQVTLLVRDPRKLGPTGERVRVVSGQITDATAVSRAIEGADVVISALGPDGNHADQVTILRDGMRTVIGAMREPAVRRMVNPVGGGRRCARRPQADDRSLRVADRAAGVWTRRGSQAGGVRRIAWVSSRVGRGASAARD